MCNIIIAFLRKNIDIIFFVFGAIVFLSVLGVNFYALDKNLIPSDEAWYLCLIRDLPHYGTTRFHLLFGSLFSANIYANRLFCWALLLLGAIIFACGLTEFLSSYIKDRQKWFIFFSSLFAIYIGQMVIIDCPSLNYITLNTIVAEFSVGFLLLGLSKDKWLYYLLSGFVVTYLFPIMVTNVIIIPLMILLIVLLSMHKLRDSLCFSLGIILFAIYYFTCVDSIHEVFSYIATETTNTIQRGSGEYGIVFLIKWIGQTFMYILRCLITAIAIYAVYVYSEKNERITSELKKWVLLIVSASLILLYSWTYIEPCYPFRQFSSFPWFKDLFWISIFIFLCKDIQNNALTKSKTIVGCFLCLIPLCLSFGTNVDFHTRVGMYYAFIVPVLLLFQAERNNNRKLILLPILCLLFVIFLHSCTHRNWHGEKYILGEKIPVQTIGINQNVKVDKLYISMLDSCAKYIPKEANVFCNEDKWITICLLNYHPISYEFSIVRNDTIAFQKMIDQAMDKNDELWAISDIWKPKFNGYVKNLNGYRIDSICAGDNRYYHIRK